MSKRVKILYFASLREQLGQDEESIDLTDEISNIARLMNQLQQRGDIWEQCFADGNHLMIAINQQMARADSTIVNNDEIAFFPPVTGG